jgi:hypothetical protein
MANAEQWLTRIAILQVYKAKGGPAPHEPLLLALTLVCYVVLTQAVKSWLIRKAWVE